jgi:hypothetical protein
MKRTTIFSRASKSDPEAPSVDVDRARAIWEEYQKHHDIAPFIDQAAGIEPESGRVWFGESGLDIQKKMHAEGIDSPFYCVRVGYDYYLRKGAHR